MLINFHPKDQNAGHIYGAPSPLLLHAINRIARRRWFTGKAGSPPAHNLLVGSGGQHSCPHLDPTSCSPLHFVTTTFSFPLFIIHTSFSPITPDSSKADSHQSGNVGPPSEPCSHPHREACLPIVVAKATAAAAAVAAEPVVQPEPTLDNSHNPDPSTYTTG